MEAVKWVEVVRVNPGNYADSKKFAIKEYTDEQYAAELKRIEEKFTPLVLECKRLNRALRVGTNHGSLSDRIMNRFGDTPLGMVESALEFARICRKHDFHNFKFSMKSSNPKVMIECYRLLVARLDQEGRIGITRFTWASRKPAKARMVASRAPSASARCCAMAWATRSAFH
jgi:(E)-4-hydroxy-3-methylbut-2-enyl-diphosphate synthase